MLVGHVARVQEVKFQVPVACVGLTFYYLRDCFPGALQGALVEIGVAARTWFDVSSCNKTRCVSTM
jgi:hypothetical protein